MGFQDEQRKQQSKRFIKFHHSCETSEDSSTLPQEIIVDILTRLPVESLLRCKSVCKSWYSLISDPRFIKSHLNFSASNNHYTHHRLIYTDEESISLHTCPLYDVMHDNFDNELDHDHPLVDFDHDHGPRLEIVGSCNGLICVAETFIILIWNPGTRVWIRLPRGVRKYRGLAFYGFGYDESTDDYKVVVISRYEGGFLPRVKSDDEVKIYSLKTGIWKKIGDFPHDYSLNDSGKFSNGALHWAVSGPSSPWMIVSINLADETYGEVLQPVYDEGYNHLGLGVLGERLCVLCNYDGIRADLWVMKVYGLKDSWTKLVSIPYLTDPEGDRFSMPLVISNDGKVLLLLGSELIVYDSKNSSFSEMENFDYCSEVNTFVESLVSPSVRWKLRKR